VRIIECQKQATVQPQIFVYNGNGRCRDATSMYDVLT